MEESIISVVSSEQLITLLNRILILEQQIVLLNNKKPEYDPDSIVKKESLQRIDHKLDSLINFASGRSLDGGIYEKIEEHKLILSRMLDTLNKMDNELFKYRKIFANLVKEINENKSSET